MTGDSLPEELAAAYRADPETDSIDVAAGWRLLRPRLSIRGAQRRRRVMWAGIAASFALAASLMIIVRTKSTPATAIPGAAPSQEYLQAVSDLETALHSARERVEPPTIATIEQSLATFDRAIRDAEAAVIEDPANDYAAEWLETIRRRKLRALREAMVDINATS
jgi:hypothetical protein